MKDINALNEKAFADAFNRMLNAGPDDATKKTPRISVELMDDGYAKSQIRGCTKDVVIMTCKLIDSAFQSVHELGNEDAIRGAEMLLHLSIIETLKDVLERRK